MRRYFFLFFLLSSLGAGAQTIFIAKSGEIAFYSKAPVENIEAHNTSAQALLNTSNREMAFRVPIRKFKYQNAMMEEHFNEKYMESDKFPMATFKGNIKEDIDLTKNGDYKVTAEGTLIIHGVEHDISAPGTVSVKEGEINVQSDFTVRLKDHNITVPQIVFQNIAEKIDVKVRLQFIPYTK